MCFIISIIGLILAFNFFHADNFLLAGLSLLVSAFFIYLMIRNIMAVRKLKKEKRKNDY